MYQDWMENTPIFGEIKDVYVEPEKENKKEKNCVCIKIG